MAVFAPKKHIPADILPIFREGNDCCFCYICVSE